jgi:hypothetical protein
MSHVKFPSNDALSFANSDSTFFLPLGLFRFCDGKCGPLLVEFCYWTLACSPGMAKKTDGSPTVFLDFPGARIETGLRVRGARAEVFLPLLTSALTGDPLGAAKLSRHRTLPKSA